MRIVKQKEVKLTACNSACLDCGEVIPSARCVISSTAISFCRSPSKGEVERGLAFIVEESEEQPAATRSRNKQPATVVWEGQNMHERRGQSPI